MTKEITFSIEEFKKTQTTEIIIKNITSGEFVSIIPESGGRIKELWLNNGKNNISILKKIVSVDSDNRDDIFTNAKLSPFAGRIEDGQYIFESTEYNLDVNYPEEKNACHGFIFDKNFQLKEKLINEKEATCKFVYNYDGGNDGYPFRYAIELCYTLTSSNGLICTTKIDNQSDKLIPLSDGWHHYYDLGIKVDDLELKLNVSEVMELDSRNIPTEKKKSFEEFKCAEKIHNRFFDSCFKIDSLNGKAVTELISKENNIYLNIWQETGSNKYEYLVIYTPPDRKTIAIEPMTSNVNAFNNGEGLIQLPPGKEYVSSFGIYLNNAKD